MVLNQVFVVEMLYKYSDSEYDVIGVFSSFENAITFIKKALEDENSGIGKDSIIQITIEKLDSYFEFEFVNRLTAKEWILKENESA